MEKHEKAAMSDKNISESLRKHVELFVKMANFKIKGKVMTERDLHFLFALALVSKDQGDSYVVEPSLLPRFNLEYPIFKEAVGRVKWIHTDVHSDSHNAVFEFKYQRDLQKGKPSSFQKKELAKWLEDIQRLATLEGMDRYFCVVGTKEARDEIKQVVEDVKSQLEGAGLKTGGIIYLASIFDVESQFKKADLDTKGIDMQFSPETLERMKDKILGTEGKGTEGKATFLTKDFLTRAEEKEDRKVIFSPFHATLWRVYRASLSDKDEHEFVMFKVTGGPL